VRLKDEFDNAYEMLCDKLYKAGAYAYKDVPGGDGEAEDIIKDLVELKGQVDSKMKYHVRTIYKKLKIEYEHIV
jgi:hypothetical protein